MGAPSFGSKEFLAGMVFNIKVVAFNYESRTEEHQFIECRIDQIWNAVAQDKPAWPITRAVHVVGAGVFCFCPVSKEDDGHESFTLNVGGLTVTIHAPDLITPIR